MSDTGNGADAGYRVLARKYRPKTFAELIGQDAMVRTLTNAFAQDRIAQAYILTGVRGTGKTTTARLIARALNYGDRPATAMGEYGPHCEAILESRHVDVIEVDGASQRRLEDAKELIANVRYAPVTARYKVYIIDEVHMLTREAFNALLKTLEEPPPHVKFIFATTEIRKVPVTILSRCQRFDLRRLDTAQLMEHYARVALAEGAEAEEEALRTIARAAEGSVRDGLSLLDRAIAHGGGTVTAAGVQEMMGLADRSRVIDLFDAVMAGDPARALGLMAELAAAGGDAVTILEDLADFVYWTTRLKIVPEAAKDAARTETERTRGQAYAARISMAHLTRAWQMLLKGIREAEQHADPAMAAEMVLIRLAYAAELPGGGDLAKLLAEERPAAGPPPRPMAPQSGSAATAVALDPAARTHPMPARFGDIVALAASHREMLLKVMLETHVRPIRLRPGQLEIALEPEAPQNLPGDLSRKLEAWTGMRWIVSVAREGGEAPLARKAKDARVTAFREASAHPAVRAVLERFPGSQVLEVRETVVQHTDELAKDEEP